MKSYTKNCAFYFLRFCAFAVANLGLLSVALPAQACSVCFVASDEVRKAYYLTTVLMILVPTALLAGIGFWLHRSFSRQSAHALDIVPPTFPAVNGVPSNGAAPVAPEES